VHAAFQLAPRHVLALEGLAIAKITHAADRVYQSRQILSTNIKATPFDPKLRYGDIRVVSPTGSMLTSLDSESMLLNYASN
jgi:hypothetical protein